MKRNITVIVLLLFINTNSVLAQTCWQSAADRYGIHIDILYAIALAESAMDADAINRNNNGSVDVGLMQINSLWFPTLATMGIQPEDLWDRCTNIHVGAWVLAGYIRRFGYNWRAIGAYNAGPGLSQQREKKRNDYAKRIIKHLSRIRAHHGLRVRAGCASNPQ